jgi:hypothetical protein
LKEEKEKNIMSFSRNEIMGGASTLPNLLNKYLVEHTSDDGSNPAQHFRKVFETLDTPNENYLKTIDELFTDTKKHRTGKKT